MIFKFFKNLIHCIFLTGSLLLAACSWIYAASSPGFRVNAARSGMTVEEASPKLTPLWNLQIQGEFTGSPVVYKDIVYCGGRDGSIYAWNSSSGTEIWQYSTDDWIDATPCVNGDNLYIPSRDGFFYCFDRLTRSLEMENCNRFQRLFIACFL